MKEYVRGRLPEYDAVGGDGVGEFAGERQRQGGSSSAARSRNGTTESSKLYVAPLRPIEEVLAGIWARLWIWKKLESG